jgi:hypothetical protein
MAEPGDAPPSSGGKYRDCAVYVDGAPLAVMSFGELPPSLPTTWIEIGEPKMKVRRFIFWDYLAALGVDMKRLRAVHLYGGRGRVAVIERAELARLEKELYFSFTQSTTGAPRMHWIPNMRTTDSIDKIGAMAVYVEKEPPTYNKAESRLEVDGKPLGDAIPYLTKELRGGARVYLDGRLRAVLKRNALSEATRAQTSTAARWRLLPQLEALGVPLADVKGADLVNLDAPVGRVSIEALRTAELTVIERSGGQIFVDPPGTPVTVLMLYRTAPPAVANR